MRIACTLPCYSGYCSWYILSGGQVNEMAGSLGDDSLSPDQDNGGHTEAVTAAVSSSVAAQAEAPTTQAQSAERQLPPLADRPGAGRLRSLKKSVERAISRATGELQAYSEALTTLVHDHHLKDPQEPASASVPATEPAPAPAPVKEDASSALRRLVGESGKRRKSKLVHVDPDAMDKLIKDAVVESAQAQAQPQSPNQPPAAQPTQGVPQAPASSLSQIDAPAELQTNEASVQQQESVPQTWDVQMPDAPGPVDEHQFLNVPPPSAPGTGKGFQNLLSRAGQAVKRTTGDVHIYADAVSKLVHERAHPHKALEQHAGPEAPGAAGPEPPPAKGLQGFVGRAIRRTTGEMAALRSQLTQLVEEARLKENVKSQERIQLMQTTERLPGPEQIEDFKLATLCPSSW